MPITHNIKSPVTLAAADITAAEIANGAVTDSKVNFSNPLTNKNLLINGGMNIWQRSVGAVSVSSSGYKTADRWTHSGSGHGTFEQSRSTDVPSAQGFSYSLKYACTSANTSALTSARAVIEQKIEAQNLQHLLKGTSSAKAVTLSFWVKSNKTGTYIIEIKDSDNQRQINKSYTIDASNTWEKKSITFEGDTTGTLNNDTGIGFRVVWWLAAGPNFTSGTLATSWEAIDNANRAVGQVNFADSTDNEWYFTGCQLEVGSNATTFEFEPFETILRKCRRYYVRWDRTGPPAEPYTHAVIIGHGQSLSSSSPFQVLTFPRMYEPMRGVPDVGYSAADDFAFNMTGSSGNLKVANNVAIYDDADHTDETLSYNPSLLVTTSSTNTIDKYGRFYITDSTNGWLELDAEM